RGDERRAGTGVETQFEVGERQLWDVFDPGPNLPAGWVWFDCDWHADENPAGGVAEDQVEDEASIERVLGTWHGRGGVVGLGDEDRAGHRSFEQWRDDSRGTDLRSLRTALVWGR